MDIYVLKNVVVRMEPAQLWMDHVTALWVSLEHTVTSHVYMDLLDSIAPSTAIAQLMEHATSSLESVSVNLALEGNIVNLHAKKVSLALDAEENASVSTMQPVIRRMAHVTVSRVGLVSSVAILVQLVTMARTVNQNAIVTMEDRVTLLMAIVPVSMNGKEDYVIFCVVTGPMVSTAETTAFAIRIKLNGVMH